MKYFFLAYKQYFKSNARSTRKEFWYFFLFNFILVLIFVLVDIFIISYAKNAVYYGIMTKLYLMISFFPTVAIASRRLHDIGRSEWNLLLLFIPFAGNFYLIYLLVLPSEKLANKFGKYQCISSI